MVTAPRDDAQRERFAREIERNFSVVAAAGSGKTTAITKRVAQIAASRAAAEILPKLVVVTFTHRAADEMQQRTRQRILDQTRDERVQTAFNSAFFGTIHSFCMKLLTSYGHHIGLPAALELVTDDSELWEEFVQQHTALGGNLSEENRRALFRLAPARQLMELARNSRAALASTAEIGPCPKVSFAKVGAAVASGQSARTIADSQAELDEWEARYAAGWEFVRWPLRSCHAREFKRNWNDSFAPLRQWVTNAALGVAAEVQRAYRNFRVARGVVTYADQIALAAELLQHRAAARRIREENFRVILDEAQDTDPLQFNVLTEIARSPDASGRWLETRRDPPRPRHFCMVGDFQQSIYHDRADLNHYRALHRALIEDGAAEELKFSVTFRLDSRQLEFVNETFCQILNNEAGQVEFVRLEPRPDVLPGQVVRLSFPANLLPEGEKLKDYQKAQIEAEALAKWIRAAGLTNLRAHSWNDVAVLCPRKTWLATMAAALRRAGVPAAVQSESDLNGDHPAYAWLTALCTVMAEPRNSYEIVGVLREIFGVADHDLAAFSDAKSERFHLDAAVATAGVAGTPLKLLAQLRSEVRGRALFDAVSLVMERTELRARLASLPPADFPRSDDDLDALLALAAQAEEEGETLADFAARLRSDFLGERKTRLVSDAGIRLITAQKAKGSEWQAVILPFLARRLGEPSPRYPCVLKAPDSAEPVIALDADDYDNDLRELHKLANQQEMARLLYVATTRARHTLVLADDRELFAKAGGGLSSTSQLQHFAGCENQSDVFEQISRTAESCEVTAQAREQPEIGKFTLAALTADEWQRARKRADVFVHKIKPSAYEPQVEIVADESAPAVRFHARPDNMATLYGRWWHRFFQTLDWRGGVTQAERHFHERQQHSPHAERSAKEWPRVRRGLFVDETTMVIRNDSALRHTEFPFIWRSSERAVVEGVIDLLLVDEQARRCTLVDWKTNDEHNADLLLARYLPQIAAYWKAVAEMTAFEVDAALFSTAIGRLLMYEKAELAEEWMRLQALPPNQLNAAVARDVEAEV